MDTVNRAMDCGAKFIVSPGLNPKVVEYCVKKNIPITPGVATPTEIEMALDFGLNVVKFFPADALGGVKTLKAISAPYGMMKFMPTGGITEAMIGSDDAAGSEDARDFPHGQKGISNMLQHLRAQDGIERLCLEGEPQRIRHDIGRDCRVRPQVRTDVAGHPFLEKGGIRHVAAAKVQKPPVDIRH